MKRNDQKEQNKNKKKSKKEKRNKVLVTIRYVNL
jgi:hypothetical protein